MECCLLYMTGTYGNLDFRTAVIIFTRSAQDQEKQNPSVDGADGLQIPLIT